MEVILLERVEKLGAMGQVVRVKDGYARNYLLPQKKALRATAANREQFEKQRAGLEKTNAAHRSEAEKNAGALDGKTCVLLRQASESGQLYGSVTARDVAESAAMLGVPVERYQVHLEHPIKNLGVHTVRIFLHPEVPTTVQVIVARSDAEADVAKQRLAKGEAPVVGEGGEAAQVEAEKFFDEGAGPREAAEAERTPGETRAQSQEPSRAEGEAPRRKKRKPRAAAGESNE